MSVLRAYADAWLAGDLATLFGFYAPDIVAHYGGTSPFAGVHVGKDRFVDVLVESAVRSSRALVAVDVVLDDGTVGALFVREALVVDGERIEIERALRFRLEDGRIAECWLYDHDQHLVDRAWSEPTETAP